MISLIPNRQPLLVEKATDHQGRHFAFAGGEARKTMLQPGHFGLVQPELAILVFSFGDRTSLGLKKGGFPRPDERYARDRRITTRVFIATCAVAVVIAVGTAILGNLVQENASAAFAEAGVRN